MNALAKQRMTVDEFLAWADGREGKWELADGVPVAMSPERAAHGRTKYSAAKALEHAMDTAKLPCFLLLDCVVVKCFRPRRARSIYV
jgi:Uma2 family endonuclease